MHIGVDVGGTKTHAVVVADDGRHHEARFPTASWRRGTLVSDPDNARRLLEMIPAPAPLSARDTLAVGAHGCDNLAQCETLRAHLGLTFPGPIVVVNDAELLAPALGLRYAIGVIAGTGSIVVGTNREGAMITKGGYGWILGDPGSAPGLTREAVVAILKAHDAGQEPGLLARLLMAHYAVGDPIQLGYEFCNDLDITHWGGLAPLVFEAATAGCPLAARVIAEAAEGLAIDVHRLREQGALGDHVVLAGGVITNQELLSDATAREVAKRDPSLDVVVLSEPPVIGALALARALDADHSSSDLAKAARSITSPLGGDL